MKKVYTELYYVSDCGSYTIHCEQEDVCKVDFEPASKDDLVRLYNFLGEFLKENNHPIKHAIDDTPKQLVHDPRFAPDPDGVLGL